jgi:hypothetical protein
MGDNLFMASQPHIPNIDLGLNDAKLVGVSTIYLAGGQFGEGFVTENEKGEKVNRFRWVFALTDENGATLYDEGDPVEVDCVTGLQFFAKAKSPSKQVRIMRALLTATEAPMWEAGEGAPPLTSLLGRPVQVEVGLNDKGYPTAVSVLAPTRSQRARAEARSAE